MKGAVAVVVALLVSAGGARAQNKVLFDEIVGSWQADDDVQYVELRMTADNQNAIANVAALISDDAAASADGRRAVTFPQNVLRGISGAKILVASTKARDLANLQPDFLLPSGFL